MGSSNDLHPLDFVCRVLKPLPSALKDVFGKVTSKTGQKELLHIISSVYSQEEAGKRKTDQIIGDCARNCSFLLNDESGLVSISQMMDPIFIRESTFAGVHRLASCLDEIVLHPSEDPTFRFGKHKTLQKQGLLRLFDFWKARVPFLCVPGFIGHAFPELLEGGVHIFRKHWNKTIVDDFEHFEVRELSILLHPDEALSASWEAGRKTMLNILPANKGNRRVQIQ